MNHILLIEVKKKFKSPQIFLLPREPPTSSDSPSGYTCFICLFTLNSFMIYAPETVILVHLLDK